MTIPRIRLVCGMALIAVVALNLGAWKALYRLGSNPASPSIAVWGWGALLMLNVLGAVLMMGGLGRVGHRFLAGFEAFGIAALALYIAASLAFPDELLMLARVLQPIIEVFMDGPYITTTGLVAAYFIWAIVTAMPQVAIALIGGFLVRNFRIR